MIVILEQMIQIFSLMLIGYIIRRKRLLNKEGIKQLSKLIVNITLPALVIVAAAKQKETDLTMVWSTLLTASVIFTLLPIISRLIVRKLRWGRTWELILVYSNIGFMGIPIISNLYGADKIVLVSMVMMIFCISFFLQGAAILTNDKEKKKFHIRSFLNAGILSSVAALIIYLLQLPLPQPLLEVLTDVGNVTSPLAMIIIGTSLYGIKLKSVICDYRLHGMLFLKMFLFPMVICLILNLCGAERQFVEIFTILFGLPVAGNVSMLCIEYGGNEELVAKSVCISTILSLVSIPFLFLILQFI